MVQKFRKVNIRVCCFVILSSVYASKRTASDTKWKEEDSRIGKSRSIFFRRTTLERRKILQTKSKTLITSRVVTWFTSRGSGWASMMWMIWQVNRNASTFFLFSFSLAIKNLLLFKLHNQAKPRDLIKVGLISAQRATKISCRIKLQCEIFIKFIKFFMAQIVLKSLAYLVIRHKSWRSSTQLGNRTIQKLNFQAFNLSFDISS